MIQFSTSLWLNPMLISKYQMLTPRFPRSWSWWLFQVHNMPKKTKKTPQQKETTLFNQSAYNNFVREIYWKIFRCMFCEICRNYHSPGLKLNSLEDLRTSPSICLGLQNCSTLLLFSAFHRPELPDTICHLTCGS